MEHSHGHDRTVEECQKFLTETLVKHPGFFAGKLGDVDKDFREMSVSAMLDSENWVCDWEGSPEDSPWADAGHLYTVYDLDRGASRQAEPSEFKTERGFNLDPDNIEEVGFIVLEDKQGNLFISDWIGA